MTIPLVPPLLTGFSCQPGPLGLKCPCGGLGCPTLARARSLFGIAPGGACRAVPVTRSAVGSYPTVSPLPCTQGGLVLCGAFPGVTPAGRYPAPLLHGVRTFLAWRSFPCGDPTPHAVIRPSAREGAYAPRAARSTTAPPALWLFQNTPGRGPGRAGSPPRRSPPKGRSALKESRPSDGRLQQLIHHG